MDAFAYAREIDISELQDCIKYRCEENEDGAKDKIPNGYSLLKICKKYALTGEEKYRFVTKIVYGKYDGI